MPLAVEGLRCSVQQRAALFSSSLRQGFELSGVAVGSKYHNPHFIRLAEYLAAAAIQNLDAEDIHAKLPGHGLASYFSLSWDAGSLGRAVFSKHETLLSVCCLRVSAETGRLEARSLGTPSLGQHHDGQTQTDLVLSTLMDHPCQISAEQLRARLAACGGDGAITQGGPQARHTSTSSAEKLWSRCQDGPPICIWGVFHRSDRAQCAAAVPLVNELCDMANELNRLFGVNSGRVLLRGVSDMLEQFVYSVDQLSGTRKLASLPGAPAHLYRNFKMYFAGLVVRLEQTERGVGSQSKKGLVEIGRRLSDGIFVAFMLVFEAVLVNLSNQTLRCEQLCNINSPFASKKVCGLCHCVRGKYSWAFHNPVLGFQPPAQR